MRNYNAFSMLYSEYGDALPLAVELFVLRKQKEEKKVKEIFGEAVSEGKIDLKMISKISRMLLEKEKILTKTEEVIEYLRARPELRKTPDRELAVILQISRGTVQRAKILYTKKYGNKSILSLEEIKVQAKSRQTEINEMTLALPAKNLQDEQLNRAIDILNTKIALKNVDYGYAEIVNFPLGTLADHVIWIDKHGKDYDMTKVLMCIYKNKKHDVHNINMLIEFSDNITELKLQKNIVESRTSEAQALKIVQLGFVLNGYELYGKTLKKKG